MYHSIVSTSKAWYNMYAYRGSKTARHDVSAVQSVVEGTFFSVFRIWFRKSRLFWTRLHKQDKERILFIMFITWYIMTTART